MSKVSVRGQARQNILRAPLVYDNIVRNAELNKNTKTLNAKLNTIQTLLKIGCK